MSDGSPCAARRPSDGPAIAMRGLGKRFGDLIAVKGIDLDVPRGSFFGLVGPNGAGKTTTLSMVTGLLRPDSGQAFVLGRDVWADPVSAKRLLGVLPDGLRLFDRLTGLQLITYAGLLRGMARDLATERATELIAALGLAEAQGKLVVDYSAGMTKKADPRVCPRARPEGARARRALRGRRPDLGSDDPPHPRGLRRRRRHGGALEPRHGSRAAAVQPRRRHRRRPGARRRRHRRGAQRPSLEERFVDLVGGSTEVEGLSWLRTSSD